MPRLGHDGKPLVLNEFEEKFRRQSLNERINEKGCCGKYGNDGLASSRMDLVKVRKGGEYLEDQFMSKSGDLHEFIYNLIGRAKDAGLSKEDFMTILNNNLSSAEIDWDEYDRY